MLFDRKKKLKKAADTKELDYVIGRLALDSSEEVRATAAANTSLPPHAAEILAEDKSLKVKKALIENTWKMTPRAYSILLLDDSSEIQQLLKEFYPEGRPKVINYGPKLSKNDG